MMNFLCGHQDEWDYFAGQHQQLVEVLTDAHGRCVDLLQAAQRKAESSADRVILGIGLACLKEFEEVCLLCGNGYGAGANKLLRAFYERVITLSYLAGVYKIFLRRETSLDGRRSYGRADVCPNGSRKCLAEDSTACRSLGVGSGHSNRCQRSAWRSDLAYLGHTIAQ